MTVVSISPSVSRASSRKRRCTETSGIGPYVPPDACTTPSLLLTQDLIPQGYALPESFYTLYPFARPAPSSPAGPMSLAARPLPVGLRGASVRSVARSVCSSFLPTQLIRVSVFWSTTGKSSSVSIHPTRDPAVLSYPRTLRSLRLQPRHSRHGSPAFCRSNLVSSFLVFLPLLCAHLYASPLLPSRLCVYLSFFACPPSRLRPPIHALCCLCPFPIYIQILRFLHLPLRPTRHRLPCRLLLHRR